MYPSRRQLLITGGQESQLFVQLKTSAATSSTSLQNPPLTPNPRRENGPEDPSHSPLPNGATAKLCWSSTRKTLRRISKALRTCHAAEDRSEKTDATSVLSLGMVKRRKRLRSWPNRLRIMPKVVRPWPAAGN